MKFQNYKYEALLVLALVTLYASINLMLVNPMKQLPSPLYGGDYYYQLGCINHVLQGGNPFKNCNLLSENPGYFPFYTILVAAYAKLLGVDALRGMLSFSTLALVMAVLANYALFRTLFKKPLLAAIGVLIAVDTATPVLKYTPFGKHVITPLFLLALYNFYSGKSVKSAFLLGLALGVALLTHSVYLPGGFFITGVSFLYLLNSESLKKPKLSAWKKNLEKLWQPFLVVVIVSLLVGILYWSGPLKKGFKTSPHYLEWNGPGDMSRIDLQFKMLKDVLKSVFFNFKTLAGVVKSLLAWLGLFYAFTLRKYSREDKFSLLTTASLFLITFSYFVTVPLLGIHFVPNYVFDVFRAVVALFLLFSLSTTAKLLSKTEVSGVRIASYALLALLVLLAYSHGELFNSYKESDTYKISLKPLNPALLEAKEFLEENSGVNDVVLTTKEVGFAINALTGRKLVVARRAQNDAFEDMDSRELDAAVMLYGNNASLISDLLKKYRVKYLYWDTFWVSSEYRFDSKGRLIGWFDPLMAFDAPQNRDYLERNNVSYLARNTYVDPSLRSKYHPRFDLLLVSPANYRSLEKPWRPALDNFLEEAWSKESGGRKVVVIYKVNPT